MHGKSRMKWQRYEKATGLGVPLNVPPATKPWPPLPSLCEFICFKRVVVVLGVCPVFLNAILPEMFWS